MRIRIDFAEINQHFFESDIIDTVEFPELLVEYIQDNYFNSCDSAVIFLGINYPQEYVELELIHN